MLSIECEQPMAVNTMKNRKSEMGKHCRSYFQVFFFPFPPLSFPLPLSCTYVNCVLFNETILLFYFHVFDSGRHSLTRMNWTVEQQRLIETEWMNVFVSFNMQAACRRPDQTTATEHRWPEIQTKDMVCHINTNKQMAKELSHCTSYQTHSIHWCLCLCVSSVACRRCRLLSLTTSLLSSATDWIT